MCNALGLIVVVLSSSISLTCTTTFFIFTSQRQRIVKLMEQRRKLKQQLVAERTRYTDVSKKLIAQQKANTVLVHSLFL